MIKEKQQIVLDALESGKYKFENGKVYYFRNKWKVMKGSLTLTKQKKIHHALYLDDGRRIDVYEQVVSWLATYGLYDENKSIEHLDGDITNNKISNLVLLSKEQRRNYTGDTHQRIATRKLVTKEEIKKIRDVYVKGDGLTYLSRKAGIGRERTRYVLIKLKLPIIKTTGTDKIPKELLPIIGQMVVKGMTWKKISDEVGFTGVGIAQAFRRYKHKDKYLKRLLDKKEKLFKKLDDCVVKIKKERNIAKGLTGVKVLRIAPSKILSHCYKLRQLNVPLGEILNHLSIYNRGVTKSAYTDWLYSSGKK